MYTLNFAPASWVQAIDFSESLAAEVSLESVFRDQQVETLAAGRAAFWQGDPAQHIFEVRTGILRLYRILAEGRRAIVGFIFPGDVLGVAYRDQYLYTAEAVTEVTFRRMSRIRFHYLVNDSPGLRPALLAKLCDEMCAAQDQMLVLLHRSAEARVASFLLMIGRKTNGGVAKGMEIQIAMSRTDIGDYLGLTIETICRCIGKLKADGLIGLRGPHHMILKKPRALGELAGDEESCGAQAERPATWAALAH